MTMRLDKEIEIVLGLEVWRAEDPFDFIGWEVVFVDTVNPELPQFHQEQEYIVNARLKSNMQLVRTVVCNIHSFPVASLESK
jgi:hypothetical protein